MSNIGPIRRANRRPPGAPQFRRRAIDQRELTAQVARNEEHDCEVRSCGLGRSGLGRYCRGHADHYAHTGHPTAPSIRLSQWRPYVIDADRFVTAQLLAGHDGIEAAIRWLAKELKTAEACGSSPADPHRPITVYYAALCRAGRNGVVASDFLGRWIATHLIDDRGTDARPWVQSDMHHRTQGTRLYLAAMPIGPSGWSRRKRAPQLPNGSTRLGTLAREFIYLRVNGALGVLCARAAAEINRRQNPPTSTPQT